MFYYEGKTLCVVSPGSSSYIIGRYGDFRYGCLTLDNPVELLPVDEEKGQYTFKALSVIGNKLTFSSPTFGELTPQLVESYEKFLALRQGEAGGAGE